MSQQEPAVLMRVADGIGEIVLNRPDQRNALNTAMCEDLLTAATHLGGDPSVRVVIVRAVGPVFCAGADVKERKVMDRDAVRARRLKAFAAYEALERLPQPAIAMVQGPVVGSGGEIATACDFILASDATTFRYPEAVGGTVGATQRLPRIVGLPRAKELLFTGRTLTAAEAFAWGLVNRVVPAGELESTVRAMAAQIAAVPPDAMRLAKRCLVQGSATDRRGALAVELLAIEELLEGRTWTAGLSTLEAGIKGPR